MTQDDAPRFFEVLNELAVFFSDQLEKERQRLYWALFRNEVSLPEWEYAAAQAMWRETFHKVPLPAVLMHFVQELRQRQEREARLVERAQEQTRQAEADAALKALRASPEWQEAQAQQEEEDRQKQEEYREWIRKQPRDVQVALGHINPPDPRRWLPLTEDFAPEGRRPRGLTPLRKLIGGKEEGA